MTPYDELMMIPTFEERLRFLQRHQKVGEPTFGGSRYLNQAFYLSKEWKLVRKDIIIRDGGWDLGVDGYPIGSKVFIHHINPITIDQLVNGDDCLFDYGNLISCALETHNAIHYGSDPTIRSTPIERRPGDTKLW